MKSQKKSSSLYSVRGIRELAVEFDGREPDFSMMQNQRTNVWVRDDHDLVICVHGKSYEEWCKLYKEDDCWWLDEGSAGQVNKSRMLEVKEMNYLDEQLLVYIAEKELLK